MRRPCLRLTRLAALSCLLATALIPQPSPAHAAISPTLSVRAVSPAPFATEIAPTTSLEVAFDRPVVPLLGANAGVLPTPLLSQPALPGSGRWVTTSSYRWQGTLRAATLYHLRIPAGLRAVDGSRLQHDYAWRFATQRPAVRAVAPADGYNYATPRPLISAGFNQPMDHASAEAAFSFRDAGGHTIPGTFSWSRQTLHFLPDRPLIRTAAYTARIDGSARSAEGPLGMLAPAIWRFAVAPYLQVTGTSPGQGTSSADLSSGVEVDFNAPVDEASAIAAVQVSPDVPNRYISFDQNDLALHIYGGFAPSTRYTIHVRAELLARAGDRLAAPATLRFTSAPLAPQLYFVTGNVATYDAYRPITLSLEAVNPGLITYTVYHLGLAEFVTDLTQQGNLSSVLPPTGAQIQSFTLRPSAPLNQNVPLQVPLRLDAGFYLVHATGDGTAEGFQLLEVTRTSVTLKVAQHQVLLWATDLQSGLPVAGTPFQILVQPGQLPTLSSRNVGTQPIMAGGSTAVDGTLSLNVPGVGPDQSLVDAGVTAVGTRSNDAIAISSNWNSGINGYDYNLSQASIQPSRRINLYTDRPIYRPGNQIRVRGVVRADDDGRYSLVGGPIYLVLTEARGNVAARRTVLLDRFGAFHATFTLAPGATLGSYGLSAESGTQTAYASLAVAEYRKPTFSVAVTTARATYTHGETIDANVLVSYYFGGRVPRARVHWSMLGYDYLFFSDLFADYSFGAYDPAVPAEPTTADRFYPGPYQPGVGGYTLFQGDATTDDQGILHLHIPARLPRNRTVQSYTLEANVTDLDNQPAAGSTSLQVYSGAFQIGLQPDRQTVTPHTTDPIHLLTLADDGSTSVSRVGLTLRTYRRTYSNVLIHHPDGSVDQQYLPHDSLLTTQTVTTDNHGRATASFVPPSGGEYHLVATALDRFGNHVESDLEIYAGDSQASWGELPQGHILLITDRRTYHSGNVAHVLVTTPYPNLRALVSIERGHIISYSVQQLTGTSTTLAIPVPSSYLPDTYVSVVVERGTDATGSLPIWRMGYARIHVDPNERALHLSVIATHSRVTPGGTLALHIHARDHKGHPMQAQLSLGVVDAAALALAGDNGAGSDLLGTFYGLRPLGVATADTLNINPEQTLTRPRVALQTRSAALGAVRNSPAPAAGAIHMSAQSGRTAGGAAIAVRKSFADTAYWNATVTTDANGNALISVPLPDNITTWHILGQAVTTNTLVGSGTSDVIATRDLLLRPLLPRFFALGDHARVGATVNNTTDRPLTARIQLLLANGNPALLPAGQRTLRLAPHAEQDVTWPVHIDLLGTATVQVRIYDITHLATNDAVQVSVPVQENSTPEEVASSGEAGISTQETVHIPTGIEPNEGALTLTLEPTLATGLRVGADFLYQYPYDSSIDIASQIMGFSELARLPARAAVLNAAERSRLRPELHRLLGELYLFQHGDGGFGWWTEDPYSSPYITVYVAEALTVARDLGYPVDPTVLANTVTYLLANTQAPAATNAGLNYDANLQAEIVYAVTQYGQSDKVAALGGALFGARYLLGHTAAAHLAMALHAGHSTADAARVATLLADLTGTAKVSGASAHWDESGYDWQALDSDTSATATVLDALVTIDPHNPLIPNTVRWLMAARKANAWESTGATAISLHGLVDYIMSSGELNGHYRYTVRLNNTIWGTGNVDSTNLTQQRTLTQPLGPGAPAGSSQRITVGRQVQDHNGQLQYLIDLRYFRPVDRIAPLVAGVGISRRYLTGALGVASRSTTQSAPAGTDTTQDNSTTTTSASAALGSTIRVQLTVTAPQDLFYLTLEDPLPAGAESVDTSLHTTTQLAQLPSTSRLPPGVSDLGGYIDHTDLRDNRTVLFIGFLPAGTYRYTYLIHCTTQGTFHTLPAHIAESYFPEVFGRGNGSYFQIR